MLPWRWEGARSHNIALSLSSGKKKSVVHHVGLEINKFVALLRQTEVSVSVDSFIVRTNMFPLLGV